VTEPVAAGHFSTLARRLAGQAGLLLGWRPDEFWRATPDEFADALGAFREIPGTADLPLDRAVMTNLMEMHPDG
jgi:uncharacterized phage protein (TIGR02216 family)